MFKKIMLITIPVVIVGAVLFFALSGSAKKEGAFKTVPCERGSIIDKALAVGTIVPRHEIAVKSKISGIVKKLYVDIGDRVKLGDPLMDIAPDPTPLEYAEANSQLDLAQVAFDNATREMDRAKTLKEKNLISDQEFENVKGKYDEAQLRVKRSKENLALIGKGQTKIADQVVENVIKSPVDGTVLARHVNIGDPVVPLTSYQAGTELLGLADMSDLVFKGTVDEIDVGKLKVGMQVELKVGALPKDKVLGTLSKISPKAHKEEGSTVFDVEINLADASATTLRAGYSANADIIITKKENILLIPERLITFAGDTAYIEIQDSIGTIAKKKIETGLSDGINIEVTNGLDSGRAVVERPPKEIKGVME